MTWLVEHHFLSPSLWLPWEPWFITSTSTFPLPPSSRFSKALVQTAAGSRLPFSKALAPWLCSGSFLCPLAKKTSLEAPLHCEKCFWVEKPKCPWALQGLYSFAVVVPQLGRYSLSEPMEKVKKHPE